MSSDKSEKLRELQAKMRTYSIISAVLLIPGFLLLLMVNVAVGLLVLIPSAIYGTMAQRIKKRIDAIQKGN